MDFLGKYNVSIECRRKVIFEPVDEKRFVFVGEARKKPWMFLSTMKARKLLANGCIGFSASIMDKNLEDKAKIKDVPIVRDYAEVFPKNCQGYPRQRN